MQSKIKSIIHRLNRRDIPLLPKFRINKYFKIILILFVVLSAVFVTKTILAEEEAISSSVATESIQEFEDKQKAMEEGNNQESWMKESVGSNAMVGINILAGTIPSDVLSGKKTSWIPGGLIGFNNKNIATLYNIPISGMEYLAFMKNNLLGKPAYADNGYQGLLPILPIWKQFRNITYSIFSIIFVAIGIMIMLRVKISPQATITIQSAIPKLITSLILVTFSYAIVGLLIDLSYVIEGLGLSLVIKATGINLNVNTLMETPDILGRLFAIVPYGTIELMSLIIAGIIIGISALISGGALAVPAAILSGLGIIVINLAVVVMIFWYTIKFFFGIVKCYVSIILKTIIAPLEIALGAIPNMKMGFNTWFTDILANIMVFPISFIVLVFIKGVMTAVAGSTFKMWHPTGVGALNIVTGSFATGGIFVVAVGFGGLMLISKLPKLIPEFIFQIKPSPYGKAIGESFAPISGFAGKAASAGVSYGIGKGATKLNEMSSTTKTVDGKEVRKRGEGTTDKIVGGVSDFLSYLSNRKH